MTLAVAAGAVIATGAIVLRSRTPQALPPPTAHIADLAQRLAVHVEVLAMQIGSRHVKRPAALRAAATYIEQRLFELDYTVDLQRFAAGGETVANVEARTEPSNEYFVVGAHYDTVPGTPGANDNTSGVAVLLELARLLRPAGVRVRFVAFVNEEPPWFQTPLMGSVVYANAAKARGDSVFGMLSLETMGFYSDVEGSQHYPAPFQWFYPNTAHFLAAVSNFGSFRLLRRFAGAFRTASPLPLIATPAPARIPGVGWSDHWAFWQAGYPALIVTDTALFRYPHYHLATDTADKLDYVRLAYATEGVASAIRGVAAGGAADARR